MLDKMTVELIDSMGDDLTIVNAARVSFAKHSTWQTAEGPLVRTPEGIMPKAIRDLATWNVEDDGLRYIKTLKPSDAGLIGYLMRNEHGTPFEMVQFQFRLHLPVRVMWEWIRHRIASYNGVSSRYVEMEKSAYMPPPEAIRGRVGKPGHYQTFPVTGAKAEMGLTIMEAAYATAYNCYQELLDLGWAPELAANVLPFGQYTEFYWSINLRSLLNFCMLRNSDLALLELHSMAAEVERLARGIVPHAFEAFEFSGRRAP